MSVDITDQLLGVRANATASIVSDLFAHGRRTESVKLAAEEAIEEIDFALSGNISENMRSVLLYNLEEMHNIVGFIE